ncbi:MAG TPA: hypothetical protein VHE55_11325 [Fimbriimonadaceae bacterium]|nr:hypothetical protein [Fimbriimonadaceae bacterium]
MKYLSIFLVLAGLAVGCKQQQVDPVKLAPPIPATPHQVKPLPVEKSETVTEEDLGLPFYPGSKPAPGMSSVMETSKNRTVQSGRTTTDGFKKVGDFYINKLLKAHRGGLGNEGELIDGQLKDGSMVQIQAMKSGPETQVQVTSLRPPKKK